MGGISVKSANWYLLDGLWWGGPLVYALSLVSAICVALRLWPRASIVLLVVAYSQLGHLFVPGDRAIDRLIRTSLLVILFSGIPTSSKDIKGWPVDLLRWLLMLVYMGAGVMKLTATTAWWWPSPRPELYAILTDPMAGSLDASFWGAYPWLFIIGGWATLLIELSSVLILSRRWAPWWALGAMWIHIFIAATLHLGMFSYGMLAFYPILLSPWFEASRRPESR
jgi:hypothetical protein